MSRKLVERLLLAGIALEVLLAVGIIGWAVFMKKDAAVVPSHQAATVPATHTPAIELAKVLDGIVRPTAIASPSDPADKRLFVVEARGDIRTIGNGEMTFQPLLDIRSRVLDDQGEMGMLGLAFHPKFKDNGYFYVNYINKSQETVIARYQVVGQAATADPATEKILLKIKQPFSNHNGGALQFGPDGYLYASLGDGGSAGDPDNRAQNKGDLLGKVLRLDVDHGNPYAIPASNPFKNTAGARGEIWAMGLRNPWRMSFDRQTGDLYIADVGQNQYEEIDVQPASSKGGENYGWRCKEASHDYAPDSCPAASSFTPPALEYDHSDKRCSVTGGGVYRGTMYPSLQGSYIYADYCSGQVYYASKAGASWQATLGASTTYSLSSFGEDSSGELYATDVKSGTLYHVTDSAQ